MQKNPPQIRRKRTLWRPETAVILLRLCLFGLLFFRVESVRGQACPLSYGPEINRLVLNDSVTIAFSEKGSGKTTLLLVHGLGGNLTHWKPLMELAGKDYRSIAVDLPGYGFSTLQGDVSKADLVDFYARTLIEFIQKRELKNVVLAGHSMGGQVAIVAALMKPDLVEKLVLAAPAGIETFTQPEAETLLRFATPQFYQNQDEKAIRAAFALNFAGTPAEPLIQDRLALGACPGFARYSERVAQGVKSMLAHPVRAQLSALRMPVLLLFGSEDRLIPNRLLHPGLTIQTLAKEGGEAIAHSRSVLIPNAGHLLMYEHPEAVYRALKESLNHSNPISGRRP